MQINPKLLASTVGQLPRTLYPTYGVKNIIDPIQRHTTNYCFKRVDKAFETNIEPAILK